MLKVLEVDGAVESVKGGWQRTPEPWTYPSERIDAVTPAILQDTFKKYFPMNRYTVVSLVPETKP